LRELSFGFKPRGRSSRFHCSIPGPLIVQIAMFPISRPTVPQATTLLETRKLVKTESFGRRGSKHHPSQTAHLLQLKG